MQHPDDLLWTGPNDSLRLSPHAGGRVLSWVHRGQERVAEPVMLEGGMMRVLFAEETYPGTSYVTPHRVIDWQSDDAGFRLHLRHVWNTPNQFMRLAGWPEKTNLLDIDGLVLDKVITFEAARSLMVCEVNITNLNDSTRFVSPWLHNSFSTWPGQRFPVIGGERVEYQDTDIYWGSHVAEPGKSMRMVHGDAAGEVLAVTGVATEHLKGMCAYLPIPGQFHQATSELRFKTVALGPGQRWRANMFMMFTPDWEPWADASPVELVSRVEPIGEPGRAAADVSTDVTALLDHWALPEERQRGYLVLSFLDKPPFSSEDRYHAAHSFAGFHATEDGRASAKVVIAGLNDIQGLRVELDAPGGWRLRGDASTGGQAASGTKMLTPNLARHQLVPLFLDGPSDLAGKAAVKVRINHGDTEPVTLTVPEEATVEPEYPYQVKPLSVYMEERWRRKAGGFTGSTGEEYRAWQTDLRRRHWDWIDANALRQCDPEVRLVERQVGPTCWRDKLLIQTEPGLWMPGYLVRPRADLAPQSQESTVASDRGTPLPGGRKPLIFFLHGSGPGKQQFAGDEDPSFPRTQLTHELEYMPYRIAAELGCLVYVPDARGCGEQGETNPAVYPNRLHALGLSYMALRMVDLPRILDALITRPDVDPQRIGSMGASGGGGTTLFFAALDERVSASFLGSTVIWRPEPLPEGYFHRMFADPVTPRPSPEFAAAPAHTAMLIAPRPLWIVDGLHDECIDEPDRPRWRKESQAARDDIRRGYELLGAADRYEETWYDAGHAAGMTFENVKQWFGKWFGV